MADGKKRIIVIDYIRGLAVFLMIIFHFSYDLNIFGYVEIDFSSDPFWFWFPRVIVFLFLTAVGLSFPLTHQQGIRWDKFKVRMLKLIIGAALISIITYFLFPHAWVYFGTLHCIAVVSLILLPFYNKARLSMALGLIILALEIYPDFEWPWIKMSHKSMDYIPALPWCWISLVSMALTNWGLHEKINFKSKYLRPLELMGRYSLEIYIIHQPIIFGAMYFIYKIGKT